MLPLLLIMRAATPVLTPAVSSLAASTGSAGACNPSGGIDTEASVHVSWSVANANSTLYSAKLYKSGVLVATQDTTASMSYSETVAGAVENGSVDPWVANWTYRVDIVRKSDSHTMDSASTSFTRNYGGCPGNQT